MQPEFLIRYRRPGEPWYYLPPHGGQCGVTRRHHAGRVKARHLDEALADLRAKNPGVTFKAVGTIPEDQPWGFVEYDGTPRCLDCKPRDRRYLRPVRPLPGALACRSCTHDLFQTAQLRLDLLADQEARKRELDRQPDEEDRP
jgi:hypothetical protein